ncbi:hypothetical protein B0H10DRAFT_94128 [Mycena sp. CBHHK59/15]|nr:hypothetical protein B0H10DRAFT_94128 [Mycena sp. CBHHK59/15]
MRRFASVFRRDKDKDSPKTDLRRAHTLAPLVPPVPDPVSSVPTTPLFSSGSEPASSASSNGSASLSLQTPDDDTELTRTPTKSKSWALWLGKKSGTIKRTRPAEEHCVQPIPEWRSKQPAPLLHAPPPGNKSQPPVVDVDSDEDASSSDSDDGSVSLPHPAPALASNRPRIASTSVAQSRKNLEILIQNSLVPPLGPSPFFHLSGSPMYPRSCNPPCSLPARPSMRAVMHKTLLLRRLQNPDVSTLTVAQQLERSILPFASHPPPTLVDPPSALPWYNDRVPSPTMRISPSSAGLRRWMARPCFEERFAVWVPMNGAVTRQPVTGSSFAVAELEYSAALDAMIGFGLPPVEEEQPLPATPLSTPQSQPAAVATVQSRNTPYMAVPSPLRNSALHSPVSQKSPTSSASLAPSLATDAPVPPSVAFTTSRVRFVEDDKDDIIPLGYALRLKKRREEKAKFLREEQEKRAFEEEKARQELEMLKREQERRKWEEEKRAWEKEKRAMEEERKQRIYAEEVAAARLRREAQRAGGGYGSNASLLGPSSSTTSLRDERNKHEPGMYSRSFHDQQGPRRQASEPTVPQLSNTPSSSPHTSSPGSSRPPSVAGPQAGSLGRNSSRPASVHTLSSSEDTRPRDNSSVGKRASTVSLTKHSTFDRSSTYQMRSSSNPTLLMPPVPPVPMYAMDMPLLPPTPPFMLHQYPRPKSQNSSSPGRSSPSASPSRQRQPSNGSSDRVNVQQQQSYRQSSASPRRQDSRSNPSSSPHRPDMRQTPSGMHHERRSSDDARHASHPASKVSQQQHDRGRSQPQGSVRSHSSTTISRGRPPVPSTSHLHPVTPWTAPPLTTSYSQEQLSPAAIINGYGARPPPQPSRRQTTIT